MLVFDTTRGERRILKKRETAAAKGRKEKAVVAKKDACIRYTIDATRKIWYTDELIIDSASELLNLPFLGPTYTFARHKCPEIMSCKDVVLFVISVPRFFSPISTIRYKGSQSILTYLWRFKENEIKSNPNNFGTFFLDVLVFEIYSHVCSLLLATQFYFT